MHVFVRTVCLFSQLNLFWKIVVRKLKDLLARMSSMIFMMKPLHSKCLNEEGNEGYQIDYGETIVSKLTQEVSFTKSMVDYVRNKELHVNHHVQ